MYFHKGHHGLSCAGPGYIYVFLSNAQTARRRGPPAPWAGTGLGPAARVRGPAQPEARAAAAAAAGPGPGAVARGGGTEPSRWGTSRSRRASRVRLVSPTYKEVANRDQTGN